MSTQINPFQFHSHHLRVELDAEGAPWFIAMDVAEILGYSDAHKMCSRLDDDEKQNRQIGGFGPRGVTVINESGLYSAIMGSHKPETKPFKRWVTGQVLPSIRKTGTYGRVDRDALAVLQAEVLKGNSMLKDVYNLIRVGYSRRRVGKMLGVGDTAIGNAYRKLTALGFDMAPVGQALVLRGMK